MSVSWITLFGVLHVSLRIFKPLILLGLPYDVSMVLKPHRSLNPLFRLRGLSGMNFFFIIIRVGYPYGCREMS